MALRNGSEFPRTRTGRGSRRMPWTSRDPLPPRPRSPPTGVLRDIDALLMPYWDESWTPDRLDRIITRLWRFLDRTIPDAFAHANVGPTTRGPLGAACRSLAQVVPNLTLKWNPESSSEALLLAAAEGIAAVNKPHIANDPLIRRPRGVRRGQLLQHAASRRRRTPLALEPQDEWRAPPGRSSGTSTRLSPPTSVSPSR